MPRTLLGSKGVKKNGDRVVKYKHWHQTDLSSNSIQPNEKFQEGIDMCIRVTSDPPAPSTGLTPSVCSENTQG